MHFRNLLALILGTSSLMADSYQGQIPEDHILLFSVHGGNYVAMTDLEGQDLWRNSQKLRHPQMLEPMSNGELLIGDVTGAIKMDAAGTVTWHRPVPAKAQNCLATILPNGNLLTGLEGPGKFQEVTPEGEVVFELKLQPSSDKVHGQFRYPTVSEEGTYLVPLLASSTFHEYNREGEILWEITDIQTVTYGLRLNNGHTLLCSKGLIQEYDADRQVVWEFNLVTDGKLSSTPVINCVVLPGGNLLCSLYQRKENQPDLIEINRAKEVVHQWTLPQHKHVAHLSIQPRSQPFVAKALAQPR